METEEERAIYPNLRYLLTRYWYRDGDAFLVESRDARGREGIFRVDAQTGEEVAIHRNTRGGEVHEFCRRPQLSPDERFLFCLDKYASGEALLYRHDLESGKDLELYRWAKSELPGFHRVSPDGRWLAFLRSDPENPADSQLMLVPSKGGEPHVLYSAQDVQFLFISTWTPDSRWILLSQPGKGSKEILYQVSADGSIARPLRAYLGGEQPMLGGRGFDVHPNGRTVAMKILGEGGSEIWAMDNIGVRKADSE